ncbi:13649_t:CDS:2 [Ambispora gerdemannii]|uniref:13649_t:CDS:1 n=1 Tax=Ambispora gerdemannii TaxID=144530 RepID=A0A9N9B5X9_9GLOM|nr:13649_t:CDS:2 [Ambispora gerdemannii]
MRSEKDLTAEQKGAIVYGYLKNNSYRTIAANVGCRKSVVGNVIRKFCESGTVKSQATLVTSENHHLNLAQITTTLAAKTKRNVSRKTVRHALLKEYLWSRIACPKSLFPLLMLRGDLPGVSHIKLDSSTFHRVLWSDESTFCLFQQSSCQVWREPHEEWDIEYVSSTVKHSPSRMHWVCFSWYGTGPLVALNGSATDNARPHISNIINNFLKENKVRVLGWPAQSPDLNPIKNLWHKVKNALRRKPNPSNLVDLERLVQEAWRDISPEFCRRLVDSMPNCVNACIKAGGGPTKY